MLEPKDALNLCREWQEYWAAHNEEKLTRFAKSAGDEIERLRAALTEVSKGEGAFSRDPLTHASNTVDSMKQIALDALAK